MKPPLPFLADEGVIPQQSTFLVVDVLRVESSLPSTSMASLVEVKLIPFSHTPFEVANLMFEKHLYSSSPRAIQVLGGRLQRSR